MAWDILSKSRSWCLLRWACASFLSFELLADYSVQSQARCEIPDVVQSRKAQWAYADFVWHVLTNQHDSELDVKYTMQLKAEKIQARCNSTHEDEK